MRGGIAGRAGAGELMGLPTTEQLAAALIIVFESEKLLAYVDSGGVWTIGIGHTGPDVHPGLRITSEQSAALFAADQKHLFELVAEIASPFRAAALVSFGFNCGAGALKKVLIGADSILNPIHTTDRHGNILPGLVARRRLEALLSCSAAPRPTT